MRGDDGVISLPIRPPVKWTDQLPDTPHVRFFRNTDWSTTHLGPLEQWGTNLRLFTRMVLSDTRPACLWWGPETVAIYNEAYVPLAAGAHPKLMGSTFRDGYPGIWDEFVTYFEQAKRSRVAVDRPSSQALLVERGGYREEAFFNVNLIPVGEDDSGEPQGFYNACAEVTKEALAGRRTRLLNVVASIPDLNPDNVLSHVLRSLEGNGSDIPLAILYKLCQDASGDNIMELCGQIGLPAGHELLVDGETIDSSRGLIPQCRAADGDIYSFKRDDRFKGIDWRGFGTAPETFAVLPITNPSRIYGYLIIGTNPCRPFDAESQQFLRDLARIVQSAVGTAVSAEESRQHQEQLENKLAFSDMQIRHMVEHSSIGMCNISVDGKIVWANDQYHTLSGGTAAMNHVEESFLDVYLDEDRAKAAQVWHDLQKGVDHVSAELRLKRLYTPPVGSPEPATIQVLAFPYKEAGLTKSIMACTTDISRLKWAESWQARLAQDAREAKRQQEAFIDVVSHEMRNPLSAIVHCADSISVSYEDCKARIPAAIPKLVQDAWDDNVAAANIILQCANHQKRIIDDVLTLSKLDSMLLSITPSTVKPAKLVTSITTIFEAELKSTQIETQIIPDPSFAELDVEYSCFDPSRVTQVFINLLTNAIKFVKTEARRRIEIRYGAALSEPRKCFPKDMFWAPKGKVESDITGNPEWGNGECVFLTFTVSDTGIGMNADEIHKIFERFRQANKKTHVKYGGSGLGLFISKQLTEKQGGEIGVASKLGVGSTFGFYIKTRRAEGRDKAASSLVAAHGPSDSGKLRVLLVEDNLINQAVLGKQLRKAGCEVEVANHGLEALNMLAEKSFGVILMDMQMPVMDGLTATTEIRKRQEKGEISKPLPIIAVTANVRQEQIDTAIAAGADRVMQKPFKAADLVRMMRSLVPEAESPAPGILNPPG